MARQSELSESYHGDLWGSRSAKNEALWAGRPAGLSATRLPHKAPHYGLVARNFEIEEAYRRGVSIADLMPANSVGIVTARDALSIDMDREALWKRVQDFARSEAEALRSKYELGSDVRDWKVSLAKGDVIANLARDRLTPLAYRPFDMRWTYYTGNSRGFHCYPRNEVMRHMIGFENLGLVTARSNKNPVQDQFLVTEHIAEAKFAESSTQSAVFPLYLYPDNAEGQGDAFASPHRTLNLDPKLYAAICRAAGIDPADQAGPDDDFRAATGEARPSEVKVFDYIYGVLHSPAYRETLAEFLKIDFPRIPYPPSPEVFRHVSEKGEQLRRLHLMEPGAIGDAPYPYMGEGDDVVASGYPKWAEAKDHPSTGSGQTGKVFVNKDQYFEGVPKLAWEFHIGGYQPAQKWLKDRRGRTLSFDDITHYQRIVKVLAETDRVMKAIELPLD